MISLLRQAGMPGLMLALWVVVGVTWAVGWSLWWWRRRDPVAAALKAAERALQAGASPRAQYEAGRQAALEQTADPGQGVFSGVLVIWVALLLMAGVVLVVTTPDLALVAEVLQGRYEFPDGGAPLFVRKIARALVNGTLAAMLLGPAALVAGLAEGFVRGWLLGAPVDRALRRVLTAMDQAPENAGHPEMPALRDLTRRLDDPVKPAWHVSGFLLGPFWYLGHGRLGRLVGTLIVYLLLAAAGYGIWVLVPRWVAPEAMILGAGSPLSLDLARLWPHLGEFWPTLMVLPLLWRIGARGNR